MGPSRSLGPSGPTDPLALPLSRPESKVDMVEGVSIIVGN